MAKKKGKKPRKSQLIEMNEKVVDFDPSKPSPRTVLLKALKDVDNYEAVVVLISTKNGGIGMMYSFTDHPTICMMKEYLTKRIHDDIAAGMSDDEDID